MQKVRVDCQLDQTNYIKLLGYIQSNGHKNGSRAINAILNDYFKGVDEQKIATDNLNHVIQDLTKQIDNLQLELRLKNKGDKKK